MTLQMAEEARIVQSLEDEFLEYMDAPSTSHEFCEQRCPQEEPSAGSTEAPREEHNAPYGSVGGTIQQVHQLGNSKEKARRRFSSFVSFGMVWILI